MNLRRATLEKHGFTAGCPGCNGMIERRAKIPMHWASCRERLRQEMQKDPEDRQRVAEESRRLAANKRARVGVEESTAATDAAAQPEDADERARRLNNGKRPRDEVDVDGLRPLAEVRLKNLRVKHELNERHAVVEEYLPEKGRWKVRLDDGTECNELPENLERRAGGEREV